MINDIISGITKTLDELYSDRAVYVETVKQGLQKGDFIVSTVADSLTKFIGDRGQLNTTFCIHYFPLNESKEEMNDVKMNLYTNLEFVTTANGDLIRGTDMYANIIDDGTGDVLHFFVSYNIPVTMSQANKDYMQTLTQERSVKQ